jgi:Fe-S-cluster containining protein
MIEKNELTSFNCTRCGTCCTWPGYVRLTPDEIEKIASFLKIKVTDFTDKYTELTADRKNLTLIEKNDGSCIFYTSNPPECAINPVKPAQCINFPLKWSFEGWETLCQGEKSFKKTNSHEQAK